MTIGELYDICEENVGSNIVAIINGKEFEVSAHFYIMSGITYYHAVDEESPQAIGIDIMVGIEEEAMDDCWNPHTFRGRNTYEDCEVAFVCNDHTDIERGNYYLIEDYYYVRDGKIELHGGDI